GTVKVTFEGGNLFEVTVSLTGSEVFAITGLTGFAFNLATGLSAPTLSNVSTGWTPTSGTPNTGPPTDGMGSAQYGLDNSVRTGLTFDLTGASAMTLASFVGGGASTNGNAAGTSYLFLADVCTVGTATTCTGVTGLAGAGTRSDIQHVPGPIVGAG